MPDGPPGGDRDHSRPLRAGNVPIGLRYLAEDAGDVQAVELPAAVAGERIVVVGEPGHDAGDMWVELTRFMDAEGIPYAR